MEKVGHNLERQTEGTVVVLKTQLRWLSNSYKGVLYFSLLNAVLKNPFSTTKKTDNVQILHTFCSIKVSQPHLQVITLLFLIHFVALFAKKDLSALYSQKEDFIPGESAC